MLLEAVIDTWLNTYQLFNWSTFQYLEYDTKASCLLVRTGPDSELARMNTLVSLSPNVKRTILST